MSISVFLKTFPSLPARMGLKHKSLPAFTLIELLVVIAIIGLLSSVVLASLNSARNKAADAAVRTEADQMRILMEEEAGASGGSYANLESQAWIPITTTCSFFTGTYGAQAQLICQNLLKDSGGSCGGGFCVLLSNGMPGTGTFVPTKYSINVYLPGASAQSGAAQWLCVGSGGATSISAGAFTEAGCFFNP